MLQKSSLIDFFFFLDSSVIQLTLKPLVQAALTHLARAATRGCMYLPNPVNLFDSSAGRGPEVLREALIGRLGVKSSAA